MHFRVVLLGLLNGYEYMTGKLWPTNLQGRIQSGFSDDDLELVCDSGLRGVDELLQYKSSRWIYWPVELYSLGRCYRDWLNIPSWAPLPLYGDHGVCFSSQLSQHELEAKPKAHLTWFNERARGIVSRKEKKVIQIPHPWITYRRKYGLQKKEDACGTLIFFSHSNDGVEIVNYDWHAYFEELQKLPDKYHPMVVCMHRHDINKGYHKIVREYKIPIVSAGDTSSPYFIDRFYDVISSFKYATSNSGGSELFYCEELGVKYFITGNHPMYFNFGSDGLPRGVVQFENQLEEASWVKKRELFSRFPPVSSADKEEFVRGILGLDLDIEISRNQLKKYLFLEYFRHIPEIGFLIFVAMARCIVPVDIKNTLRKFF